MAIAGAMSRGEPGQKDGHEDDLVMPGFRFHPTDEELVGFYLRRKVEGKRFNVELIAFLDLYGHDPWELPALAAIGEKEWFFYVPRDRKYRNGDRPNRVTTSGYWKATGADRTIRSESSRPIGLKKTLVFYSGKAPKGVRTGWIMNEFRLPPQPEADRNHHKAEITLCRVYKRAGADARRRSAATDSSKASSPPSMAAACAKASGKKSGKPLPRPSKAACASSASPAASLSSALMEEDYTSQHHRLHQPPVILSSSSGTATSMDDLNKIVSCLNQQPQLLPLHHLPPLSSAKLWEWNPFAEAARSYRASY